MKEPKVKLMDRMLRAEPTVHLDYEEGKAAPAGQANRQNRTSAKVLKGQDGEMPEAIPRDRDGSFEPELVEAVGLYAVGLSVREIRAHLRPEGLP